MSHGLAVKKIAVPTAGKVSNALLPLAGTEHYGIHSDTAALFRILSPVHLQN